MMTIPLTPDEQARSNRSKKMLLIFAMGSMTMMFAALTSAFIISKSRADWLKDFQMPIAFYYSTAVIIACSVAFHWALRAAKRDDRQGTTIGLLSVLALAIAFILLQLRGFDQIVSQGYYFTGSESNITTTFLYVVTVAHLMHVAGGMVALLVIIYNHFKQKYNSRQTIGIELGAMYWHFLDLLWVYLFLFLYFFK